MNQKGFFSIALFALIALLLAGGAGYYFVGGNTMFTFEKPTTDDSWQEDLKEIQKTAQPKKETQIHATTVIERVDFTANPTTGATPLSVWFTTTLPDGIKNTVDYFVSFGDGTLQKMERKNDTGTSEAWSFVTSYTYKKPGTYSATLSMGTCVPEKDCDLKELNRVKIVVSEPVSVPGMSKYTDADFGFSFWYPTCMAIGASVGSSPSHFGGRENKIITISFGKKSIYVYEIDSQDRSVTIRYSGMGEYFGPSIFYFDAQNHVWMSKPLPESGSSQTPVLADVSNYTMGGLHIFSAPMGHGSYAQIVPLSARHFLVVVGLHGAADESLNTDPTPLIKTIVATDPSVATPVSAVEQIKTIEAEKQSFAQ
jgi:PKD repeat protein